MPGSLDSIPSAAEGSEDHFEALVLNVARRLQEG